MDVVLVVDNTFRELVGIFLIYFNLLKLGLKVRIVNRFVYWEAFNLFRPKIILLPNAGDPNIPLMTKSAHVCILPSESGNGQLTQILSTHAGTEIYKCYTEEISRFFSWGKYMSEVLLKSGKYRKDQIIDSGHPSTDLWKKDKAIENRSKKVVGFTTSFRGINNSLGKKQNLFTWIHHAEKFGGDGSFYLPPNHSESWLFWEAAYVRLMFQLIQVVVDSDEEIIVQIRPHPFENIDMYEAFTEEFGNRVIVTKIGTINEWLENVDVLVTYFSASLVDAYINQKSIISLSKLVDPVAKSLIPKAYIYDYYEFFNAPEAIKDFSIEIEKALKSRDLKPNVRMDEYLNSRFDFPKDIPSSFRIAIDLKGLNEECAERSFEKRTYFRLIKTIFLYYALDFYYLIMSQLRPVKYCGYLVSYNLLNFSWSRRARKMAFRMLN